MDEKPDPYRAIQKVEMGAARIAPVVRRYQVHRIRFSRFFVRSRVLHS